MVRAPQWRRPRVTSFCKLIRQPASSAQHPALCPHSSRALRLSIGIAREARLIERNVLALQYSDGACPNQGVRTCQAQTAKIGGRHVPPLRGHGQTRPQPRASSRPAAYRRSLRGPSAPRNLGRIRVRNFNIYRQLSLPADACRKRGMYLRWLPSAPMKASTGTRNSSIPGIPDTICFYK